MATPMFRDLTADEIECRVAQARENGISLLLYKDARCDQNILDETVGAMNWQRHHGRDNANCIVSIWDDDKKGWIEKEDTGTESNTEKEKGLASDSFKRACFNWGIGRELYTAPFIWVKASDCTALKLKNDGKTWQCLDTFEVDSIEIKNKRISKINIKNAKNGKICFSWADNPTPAPTPKKAPVPPEDLMFKCVACGKVIKPYIGTDGKEVSVRKHVMVSKAKFGKEMCVDCCIKESNK